MLRDFRDILHGVTLFEHWAEVHSGLRVLMERVPESNRLKWRQFYDLFAAYREDGRHYHALAHLVYGMKVIDTLGGDWMVKLAFFFHDYFYDPRAKDNEVRSAQKAMEYCKSIGLPNHFGDTIGALIIGTTDHQKTNGEEIEARNYGNIAFEGFAKRWAIMNDADLAIFVADRPTYLRYARNVWREYSWVGFAAFTNVERGRPAFLKNFMEGPLFRSEYATRRGWDEIAKRNIQLEINILTNEKSARDLLGVLEPKAT